MDQPPLHRPPLLVNHDGIFNGISKLGFQPPPSPRRLKLSRSKAAVKSAGSRSPSPQRRLNPHRQPLQSLAPCNLAESSSMVGAERAEAEYDDGADKDDDDGLGALLLDCDADAENATGQLAPCLAGSFVFCFIFPLFRSLMFLGVHAQKSPGAGIRCTLI